MRSKLKEGYRVLPPIDRDRYQNREHEGLEGPYTNKHGKVYYYDTKAGKYYDPDSDFYMEVDQVMEGRINNTLKESYGTFLSILENQEAQRAKLSLVAEKIQKITENVLYSFTHVLVEDELSVKLLGRYPSLSKYVCALPMTESTLSGSIASSAQPIGDIIKRRSVAEEEPVALSSDEEELEENNENYPDDSVSAKVIDAAIAQAHRDGGVLPVFGRNEQTLNYEDGLWYDSETGDSFSEEEVKELLRPTKDGRLYWNY
jgi:hypothetical protein